MSLSTSPASVSFLAYDTAYEEESPCRDDNTGSPSSESDPITLAEFAEALPPILRRQKRSERDSPWERSRRGTGDDRVNRLFGRVDLGASEEWREYALFDPTRNYTRNLIATDGETFTLLLLCWNPGKESPIHDHPCDGCWMRVCQGKIRETRYEGNAETDKLDVTSDEVFEDNEPVFINDSKGYHKVGNPSEVTAITMHLYCPPFNQCKIWLDPDRASRPSNTRMCNYSEYGSRRTCEMLEVNCI